MFFFSLLTAVFTKEIHMSFPQFGKRVTVRKQNHLQSLLNYRLLGPTQDTWLFPHLNEFKAQSQTFYHSFSIPEFSVLIYLSVGWNASSSNCFEEGSGYQSS